MPVMITQKVELLVFLIDNSESMYENNKIDNVIKTIKLLKEEMKKRKSFSNFYVSVILFATHAEILHLDQIGDPRVAKFTDVEDDFFDKIKENRSIDKRWTNITDALIKGLEVAAEFLDLNSKLSKSEKNLPNERNITFILLTDGEHTMWEEELTPYEVLELINSKLGANFKLITVGYGLKDVNITSNVQFQENSEEMLLRIASEAKTERIKTIINNIANTNLIKYLPDKNKLMINLKNVSEKSVEILRKFFWIVSSSAVQATPLEDKKQQSQITDTLIV